MQGRRPRSEPKASEAGWTGLSPGRDHKACPGRDHKTGPQNLTCRGGGTFPDLRRGRPLEVGEATSYLQLVRPQPANAMPARRHRRRANAHRPTGCADVAPGGPRLELRPGFLEAPGSGKASRAATRKAARALGIGRPDGSIRSLPTTPTAYEDSTGETFGRRERDLGLLTPRASYQHEARPPADLNQSDLSRRVEGAFSGRSLLPIRLPQLVKRRRRPLTNSGLRASRSACPQGAIR
jgi:hypothetical protein